MVTIRINDKTEIKVLYTAACWIASLLKADKNNKWRVEEDFHHGFLYIYSA